MRSQFRIYPRQVEHRRDLADRVIIRHRVSKAERIEKLPLIVVEPPHHRPPPQKIVLETRNHRSTKTSTDFCNKIGQERTFLEGLGPAHSAARIADLQLTASLLLVRPDELKACRVYPPLPA